MGWGGQEHRVLAELTGFACRGAQVWLLAPPESGAGRRALEAGITLEPLRLSRLLFPWRAAQWAVWLKRHRIEILNPHSSRDGWLLGVAGRLARVPFIVRTRHIDVDYPHAWLSRHAFTTLADHVLTTSEKIARHFQELFGLPADRVTTIPTGIDVNRFSPEVAPATLHPQQGRTPLVGMVSVLRSWKGHSTFLQAARRLVDAHFPARYIIVGEGPIRYRIEKEIGELQLQEWVTLAGHREDVPAVLRALDVVVIPSTRHEGVPQIGLQALACQTPVIGSDVGGIPEIIRPGETGRIFPAGEAGQLANAIQETLADTEQTRTLARRGRAMVVERHSLDCMLDQLDRLYQRHLPA